METPVQSLPPSPVTKTNMLSIVSLVTGILAFLSLCLGIIPFLGWFCWGFGGLLAVAALVTGFLGIKQVKTTAEKGRGMAIAGIVLGALSLAGLCVYVIITVALGPQIENIYNQILTPMP